MPKKAVARWRAIETLHDMDARKRMLDEFGDYQQIISMSQPPIDVLGGPDQTPALARIANDGMAAICKADPDRFPSFLASPAMNNPDAAVAEVDRAVGELGACGLQVHSNVNGRALDDPAFFPVFERMAQLDRPIFLHPARPMSHADYAAEDESKFEIFWGLGWAYETSAAMARIVFSGMFDKLPALKIVAHHWGAYIPHAGGRITPHWDGRSSQSDDTSYGPLGEALKRPAIDYFKMFYVDTAMFGAKEASQCGLDFFGAGNRCSPRTARSIPRAGESSSATRWQWSMACAAPRPSAPTCTSTTRTSCCGCERVARARPMTQPRDVTIIGAGIVGLSSALALQRDGHRVTLIDPLPPGEGTSSAIATILTSGRSCLICATSLASCAFSVTLPLSGMRPR